MLRRMRSFLPGLHSRPSGSLSRGSVFSVSTSLRNVRFVKSSRFMPPRDFGDDAATRELFHWTSSGFLRKEARLHGSRYLPFNVQALSCVVAAALNVPNDHVVGVRKFHESNHYRHLEVTLQDNRKLLVLLHLHLKKTPGVNAQVASHIATMDFARSLGMPVAKIVDFSKTHENPVGIPYVIMEKPPGRVLDNPIYGLNKSERERYTVEMAKHVSKMTAAVLPAFGSIYYERDLEPGIRRVPIPDTDGLCVGPPPADYHRWSSTNVGPFTTALELYQSLIQAKLQALVPRISEKQLRSRVLPLRNLDYKIDIAEYCRLLEKSRDMIGQVMAPHNDWLLQPTLAPLTWLRPMVSPNGICFINFQCSIQPLFVVAHYPSLLRGPQCAAHNPEFPVPIMPSQYLPPEQLRNLYKHLIAWHHHSMRCQTLQVLKEEHAPLYDAIGCEQARRLYLFALSVMRRNLNIDVPLKESLIGLTDHWGVLASTDQACPFRIEEEQRSQWLELSRILNVYGDEMTYLEDLAMMQQGYILSSHVRSYAREWQERILKDMAVPGHTFQPQGDKTGYQMTTVAGQTGPGIYSSPDEFEQALCENLHLSRDGLRENILRHEDA